MAWDEWEQIKAAVRSAAEGEPERGPGGGSGTGPGADAGAVGGGPGEPGEPGERLLHSAGPWRRAAATARQLRADAGSARTELLGAHEGLVIGEAAAGLVSRVVLRDVLGSWEARLSAVRDECERLEPVLHRTAGELPRVDTSVGRKLHAVRVPHGGGAR